MRLVCTLKEKQNLEKQFVNSRSSFTTNRGKKKESDIDDYRKSMLTTLDAKDKVKWNIQGGGNQDKKY